MKTKILWRNIDTGKLYYEVEEKYSDKFQLCAINGSLSSIKTFDNPEEAIREGYLATTNGKVDLLQGAHTNE